MQPWDGHDLNFYVKIMSGTWRLIMDASHVQIKFRYAFMYVQKQACYGQYFKKKLQLAPGGEQDKNV